ncbi:proteasome inhibitor PI31 subunit [Chelonus insularis]|uniref:proteasome inhibitor PI31 subunit n=1 Tax=Chelonus insularis TaxID=460826 RepID=UPI00158D04C8|nr:proteasome inhibitor PI31 subunit [Chelonus insularis]
MASATNYFGFELLNKLVDDQLQKKEDVIILFVHWFLIKNGFKCIGLGDSKTFEQNEEGSEILPEGWSQQNHYALRYLKNGELYIFLGRRSDNNLLLNFLPTNSTDNEVSNVKFPIETTVNSTHGPLSTLIPTYQDVINKISKELIEPVCPEFTKETSTQTLAETSQNPQELNRDHLQIGPQRLPQRPLIGNVYGVGRRDLDPFGGIGPRDGGMLFDPFHPGGRLNIDPLRPGGLGGPNLPPAAIPPGARFDPFGPPDVNRPGPYRRNPDHDHLPPPGYDDMFQ